MFRKSDPADLRLSPEHWLCFHKYLLRFLPLPLLLTTCACERLPEWYPPPAQRPPITDTFVRNRDAMLVNMNDGDAPEHFVRDIEPKLEGGRWRWTQKRPTIKILLSQTQGLKLVCEFTIWEGTMAQTGPVTISFFVGDKLLQSIHYDTPGYKHFAKPVPPEWLQTSTDTVVSAEIDKLYKDPADGGTLGFILTSLGFERQ